MRAVCIKPYTIGCSVRDSESGELESLSYNVVPGMAATALDLQHTVPLYKLTLDKPIAPEQKEFVKYALTGLTVFPEDSPRFWNFNEE